MTRVTEEDDDGPEETGPERTCVATRVRRPVDDLIRFVAAPDGTVVPDLKRNLPGRGVWVTATRDAVAEAVKKKAFGRGLKAQVSADGTLPALVESLLAKQAREAVSLANKAGLVISGFDKVEAAIGRGPVRVVIHASDAAADGVRKLSQAVRRRFGESVAAEMTLRGLNFEELGLALGRSHVIHAALLDGPASRLCVARLRALERYRTGKTDRDIPDDPGHEDGKPLGQS